jgi:hypothetical protein
LPDPDVPPGVAVLRELFAGTFVSWYDLFSDELTEGRLIEWVRAIPTETVIAVCSALSRLLAVGHEARQLPHYTAMEVVQRQIANWVLSPIYSGDVVRLLTGGARAPRQALVHDEQLLLAMKLAVLHGQDGPPELAGPEHWHAVGRILLGLNGLLGRTRVDDPESDLMLGMTVRGLSVTNSEPAAYLIARYFHLLAESSHGVFDGGGAGRTFDADFASAYGVSIEEFMALAALCAAPFANLNDPLASRLGPGGFWQAGKLALQQMAAAGYDAAKLDLVAGDKSWYASQFAGAQALWTSTFYPFYERPFYRSVTDTIIPLSHRLSLEKIGSGVYWMLHAAHRAQGGRAVQHFMGAFGGPVEEYIDGILRRSFPPTGTREYIPGGTISAYRSPGFPSPVDGGDGYLMANGRVVVFEMTGSAIPAQTLLSGDGARFRDDFERKMVMEVTSSGAQKLGKFAQLDRVVRDLIGGHLILPGLAPGEIKEVFPVLVSLTPFPQLANIWSVINDILSKWKLFQFNAPSVLVHPPQIATVEELELLEAGFAAGEYTLPELLWGKWCDPFMRDSSLKNYLVKEHLREHDNPELHAIYDRYRHAVIDVLVRRGLADAQTAQGIPPKP